MLFRFSLSDHKDARSALEWKLKIMGIVWVSFPDHVGTMTLTSFQTKTENHELRFVPEFNGHLITN